MTIDPKVVQAIMALVTGGIVTIIVQFIKTKLNITGTWAVVLTGAVCAACTAVYFLWIAPPFSLVPFVIYAVVVFGEATGFYHLLPIDDLFRAS